ncbi:zinc protease [Phycisphaerales bacterium]|nr:zinc protease [Phycisphaerales bacterium]
MMRSLCVVLAAASGAAAQTLPTDPNLVTGQLENGLSYVIMKHGTPPGRASVWMHVSSGSINETDKQRGLAHFLEHMAFNGSENFPPGSVIHYFESLGLTFGRDQNAFTNFDQTTYQLALPDNKPETLSKGLLFFSDVCSKLLLKTEEIDLERGVILNEKMTRKSAGQRIGDYMIERIAPGSLYSQRLVIGTDATLTAVQRQDFVDYYTKWYGPANSTVIVVADMDPNRVIVEIKERFESLGMPRTDTPVDHDPGITPYAQSFGVVATDPELVRGTVLLTKVQKAGAPVTTEAQLRAEWVEDLAQSAFSRRMSDQIARGGTPFRSASAGIGQNGRIMKSITANATGTAENWREMLQGLIVEIQRAREFGFSKREIDEARTELIASFEQSVRTEGTLPASAHLARINNTIAQGRPLMNAPQRLELANRLMPGITPEECSAVFKKAFDLSEPAMFGVQLPTAADNPTEEDVVKVGTEALKIKVEPLAEASLATTLMKELPKPGAVKESDVHEGSQVASGWLSNGVRFHYRFMDARKDQVSVSIALYGGELDETASNRGITTAASLALGGGGGGGRGARGGGAGGRAATKHLTSSDIRSLLTGKNVRVGGRSGMDAIQVSVNGSPEDLESGMQLAYLLLTEPLIEGPAFDRWKETTLQTIEQREKSIEAIASMLDLELTYPANDPRMKVLTKEHVESITKEAAQARLEHLIATSPIEVAVVGDISKEKALDLLAKYVGALPSRGAVGTGMFAEMRTLPAPKGPKSASRDIDTITDRAAVSVAFYGPDERNTADVRAMTLATRIVSSRMVKVIREERALVYSIGCGMSPGTTFPGYGVVRAGAPCQPDKAGKLGPAIVEVFDGFAKSGPTDEEMETVRKQFAKTVDDQMKEPSFWMGRIATLTYDGLSLDDIVNAPEAYQKITAAQIKDVFNKYYGPTRTISVTVKPKGKEN